MTTSFSDPKWVGYMVLRSIERDGNIIGLDGLRSKHNRVVVVLRLVILPFVA